MHSICDKLRAVSRGSDDANVDDISETRGQCLWLKQSDKREPTHQIVLLTSFLQLFLEGFHLAAYLGIAVHLIFDGAIHLVHSIEIYTDVFDLTINANEKKKKKKLAPIYQTMMHNIFRLDTEYDDIHVTAIDRDVILFTQIQVCACPYNRPRVQRVPRWVRKEGEGAHTHLR